ncbi:STN domain-containing protein [uncultured Kushneria sp.]|uniref:STN domain-containing protein n=1 Tax=uncultured Kushneria sp. TaxID=905033 RepID=UPI0026268229|nr:STN domain-containing protein [uncultured Kushneria sp.]
MRDQRLAPGIKKPPFRTGMRLALIGAVLGCSAQASAACQIQAIQYDYPEQRLDQALEQFAHTSGCPVEVDSASLGNLQAPALSGRFTPGAALIQLVRGSGLEVHLDNGHYRINQSDREHIEDLVETFRYRIDSARDNNQLTQDEARDLDAQLDAIEAQSDQLITEQGFLSAAEKAGHERFFAWLEGRLAPGAL